ncbi:hypothetical protein PTT_08844 [Pyrenophora teres f. teres 0-1]|uniref:Uncharacterized protein n=1 Tax=Pyrenophora teres f. teres (strain 0-1) TaxID=861557 RepID=E3RKQ7_PYRTT|nr:hypothetical protein PTT_08844 [Pyrenophora teres f. teres 0-1]
MAKFLLALLGMAAIALAQNPSSTFVETNTEPYYGPNGLVYPTLSAAPDYFCGRLLVWSAGKLYTVDVEQGAELDHDACYDFAHGDSFIHIH